MIVTHDRRLYEKICYLRNQGMKIEKNKRVFKDMGYNYRLGEINAILGIQQTKALPEIIRKHIDLAKCYFEELSDIGSLLMLPTVPPYMRHIYQSFVIRLKKDCRKEFSHSLAGDGIETVHGNVAVHKLKYISKLLGVKKIETSSLLDSSTVALPLHANMSNNDIRYISGRIKLFFKNNI